VTEPAQTEPAQLRAELDFEITFANGGGLSGTGFRIDIPDSEADLAEALVRDLGLLMVDGVRISRQRIFADRHKRAVQTPDPAPPGSSGLRRADLSHVIEDGMVTIPGFPVPRVQAQSVSAKLPPGRYAPGVSFAVGEIMLCGNTSTYLDSPFHLLRDGADLAALPLDRLAGLDGIVVDVSGSHRRPIGPSMLAPYDVAGQAVLIRTGWDTRWGSDDYHRGHPFLTAGAARLLVASGAVLVGIDGPNVDDTDDPKRPAHAALLSAGIGICEHLTGLDALPGSGFRFTAVPPKIAGFGTFPVRAYATWPL
jgi:kynurenine formamidase